MSLFFVIENFAELQDIKPPERSAIYTSRLRELAGRIQETIPRSMAVSRCDDVLKPVDADLCGVVSEQVDRQSGYAELKAFSIREQSSVTPPVMVKADRLSWWRPCST